MKEDGKLISVIIATKDRSRELETISLISLLDQDTEDYEVIVWDASSDDLSKDVVNNMAGLFDKRGLSVRYYRAPRAGSASQRNDAVGHAKGEIFFFIDDDSEVSSDGIRGIRECFDKFPPVMGAALPVNEVEAGRGPDGNQSLWERLVDRLYEFVGYRRRRRVFPSGSTKGISATDPEAEWLSGCSMAFRREVFEKMRFNEKLERFGPYANGEDVELSHRVFLRYGAPLRIAETGRVFHRHPPGAQPVMTREKIAMLLYNRYLIMKVASVRAPLWGRAGFFWNVTKRVVKMSVKHGFVTVFDGLRMAWEAAKDDVAEKVREPKNSF